MSLRVEVLNLFHFPPLLPLHLGQLGTISRAVLLLGLEERLLQRLTSWGQMQRNEQEKGEA